MMRRTLGAVTVILGLTQPACIVPPGDVGALPTGTEGSSGTSSAGSATSMGGDDVAEGSSGDGTPHESLCGPGGPPCDEDEDRDCVGLDEDNDPEVYNPDQSDHDGDGFADLSDRCPSLPGATDGTADSDDDGLGNGCDPCRRPPSQYNKDEASPPGYMLVRNIPSIADADGDGIGDACDNCVHVPNCDGYGPGAPWQPGDPIAFDDAVLCQLDADDDMVGDACAGDQGPGAAGPVGLGPNDDFDQDGLTNVVDACPRQPLADAIPCATDADCPSARKCELSMGLCDHVDHDGDGVGDACDTCPTVDNPMQVADGAMQEADDVDGDFIGDDCELGQGCELQTFPRPTGFYPVAVEGQCCTVTYRGDGTILDPNGVPVLTECAEADEGVVCRRIPLTAQMAPGLVALPNGCAQALADAGLTVETHLPLTPADVGGLDQLWAYSCQLPPLDQDFDGLADACDLCPYAFDPENQPFIDVMGNVWPDAGRYCNGDYALNNCG